jgi:adenylate kinase
MGLEVKDIVESGKLVPDALVVGLIKDFLGGVSAGAKIVFDGFPRNVSQANVFLEMLSSGELGAPTVVEIGLGGDTAVDRIKGRSGESERADDDDTVVHARMSVYKEQTEPMIDFFREKGILKTIDGSGTVDTVYSRLSDVLRLINH